MNYNKTAALDKITCAISVDLGNNEDGFGRSYCSQIGRKDNRKLGAQLKVFRGDDKAEFRKHQQVNLGESNFKQLLKFRNPIVVATGDFSREENSRSIVASPLSKGLEEQLKPIQKAITIVDRPKKEIIATKMYCVDKPDNTYVQILHFMRKNEAEKFQQLVFVN